MGGSVWLTGRMIPQKDDDTIDYALAFSGVYRTYAEAFATCMEPSDFIVEMPLNTEIDYDNLEGRLFFPYKVVRGGGLPA